MARLYIIYISISNSHKNLKGRRNLKLHGKGKRMWIQEKKTLYIFYLSHTKLVVRFPQWVFQSALIIIWGWRPNSSVNWELIAWGVGSGDRRIDEVFGEREAHQPTLARNDGRTSKWPQREEHGKRGFWSHFAQGPCHPSSTSRSTSLFT